MSAADIISLCLSSCACMIFLMLIIAAILERNWQQKIFRYFFFVAVSYLISLVAEFSIAFFIGVPGMPAYIAVKLLDYISYAVIAVSFWAHSMYCFEYIKIERSISRLPYYFTVLIFGLQTLFATIFVFTGLYGDFDEMNRYQQGDLFWVSHLFPILSFVNCTVTILFYWKKGRSSQWIPLLLFPVTPIICYALEIWVEDLWIAHFGGAMILLLIYITLHVNLHDRFNEQQLQLSEARISIMMSQIKPHFLYNSLAAIGELCYLDAEDAHKAIITFSNYMRTNMESLTIKNPVPFAEELELVERYLYLEKLRFQEKLEVTYEIGTEGFAIPSFTLQPIVENAVKYGVESGEDICSVTIRTVETRHAYLAVVVDNGPGFDPQEVRDDGRSHIGIANVRERLAAMCGGGLYIESQIGSGTIVTIEIPKSRASRKRVEGLALKR